MKKGFSDCMFVPRWDMEKFLKLTAKAGFDGVELNFREDAGDLTDDTSYSEAKAVADMANDFGLEVPAISTLLHNKYAISAGDKKQRDRGIEIASKMIEIADATNSSVVQVVPGVLFEDVPYQKSYELAQEALLKLGDEAKSAGVTIGLENVCNNFLGNPLEFSRFINEINHPNVKFYLDNGNALRTGYPEHYLDLMGDQLCCVHFKDYRKETNDYVLLLEGDINWPSNMKMLRDLNYDGYIINTPGYPYKYCPERLVEKSSHDLACILNMPESVESHS